jgi:hypothetical protein
MVLGSIVPLSNTTLHALVPLIYRICNGKLGTNDISRAKKKISCHAASNESRLSPDYWASAA